MRGGVAKDEDGFCCVHNQKPNAGRIEYVGQECGEGARDNYCKEYTSPVVQTAGSSCGGRRRSKPGLVRNHFVPFVCCIAEKQHRIEHQVHAKSKGKGIQPVGADPPPSPNRPAQCQNHNSNKHQPFKPHLATTAPPTKTHAITPLSLFLPPLPHHCCV